MASSFENLEMGPCTISFKGEDLGLTKGGVEVEFATEVTPIVADQFGDTAIDNVIKGRSVKAKVPLAETDLEKFATVIPGATLVTNGTDKKLIVKSAVGTSLRAAAGPLVLHPKARAADDKSRDIVILHAMAKGDMQFAFKTDDQRVYSLEFDGFVDMETEELFIIGDPDLVPTPDPVP